ncbi:uncharacterized protein LOC110118761 isoform X3 [Ceratitis capitata]|uniref:uncharacterized protein LOC110118761 isoform X3 n=1 Tax=Ceratitis capitata TaxID=7213 RepID=UPI000A10AFBC|nr:uncharacterized protein LOC110118761 isoform X3 [Ceratitis capitata]
MSRWVSQKKLIIRRGTCNTIFGNTELKWISPFFHKGLLNLNKAKVFENYCSLGGCLNLASLMMWHSGTQLGAA